jgi:hypothetical protein
MSRRRGASRSTGVRQPSKSGLVVRAAAVALTVVLVYGCATKPTPNPADTLTVFNLDETRMNKEEADTLNEGAFSLPSWLVLRPSTPAYINAASVVCPTSHLRVIVAGSLAAFDEHRNECQSLAKIVVVSVEKVFHVAGDDYVIKARSANGTVLYVGGGDIAPVIPKGTQLAVPTDPSDCGGPDNPPCGAEVVDGSGNLMCTLAGGETVRLLDFQPTFDHQLHVEVENGPVCPGVKGYMDEFDVEGGLDAHFGFADVSQGNHPSQR